MSSGSLVFRSQRGYDAASNVTAVNTTLAAGTDNQVFCYDEQNRLTWAGSSGTPTCGSTLTPGTLTSANYTQPYAYDTLDRLTSGPLGSYSYGDSAHLHAATSIGTAYTASYDAVGDMTCRAADGTTTCSGTPTGAQLSYDNEGRLSHWQNTPSSPTTTDDFVYDGEGNRVEQLATISGSPVTTVYVAGGLEEVTTSGVTTTLTKYFSAPGLPTVERVGTNGPLSYLASDGQGSVSETLDGSGAVTFQQLYTPYGVSRYSNGSSPTTLGYTGQRADNMTGLAFYHARYYDPAAGQFTSADTVNDGLNRYGYVHGNPATHTDPTGHMTECKEGGDCGPHLSPPPASPPPPPPTGCHSDGSCGCYANCGGNGNGGHNGTGTGTNRSCGGGTLCSSSPLHCRPVCDTGQRQEGGLLSLAGYNTSQLTVVGYDGITFLIGLLQQLLGSIQTRALAVGGVSDAAIAFFGALTALAAPPLALVFAGLAVANSAAFFFLYSVEEDRVSHLIAYLYWLQGAISDNPSLRDSIEVNLVETRLPDSPVPNVPRGILRAAGVGWGHLSITSPQIDGSPGVWPTPPK